MSTVTDRLATAPRAPLRLLVVAILLIVAIAALIIVAGGSHQPRVPAPFGVATNGRIAWVDGSGAIVAATSGTAPATIVTGPGNSAPQFSPDGARLLYLHDTGGGQAVVVVAADGTGPVTIGSGAAGMGAMWAPDSRSVVLADGGTISVVDARTGASPVKLADGVSDTYDWNVEPAVLYRPPTGDQIAYLRRTTSGTVVVLARADGTSPHDILTPADGLAYTDLGGLRWSPDGTRLAMTVYLSSDGLETSVYVVNADGSGLRRASDRAVPGKVVREANPQWSPDGTRIAMQTWFADAEQLDQQETGPIAVVEVASGDTREIGTASVNGFKGWGWSPDGTSIVVVPDAGRVATIDVATGKVHSDAWQSTSGATWQRTAP